MDGLTTGGWSLVLRGGLGLVRCGALEAVPGIGHGFSTRLGARGQDFDLRPAACQDEPSRERHLALLAACGLEGRGPVALDQVHGNQVRRLGEIEPGARLAGDAIVGLRGDRGRGAPGVRYADCLPILLVERAGRAVGAVHAGWRGTAAGVAGRAVREMGALGIPAEDLLAALGPAIGSCCYEVGGEVLEAVARTSATSVADVSRLLPRGTRALDLVEANRRQLIASGLAPESVHGSPWCTHCREDLFFSHRRQGSPAGRMLACIGWVPDRPLP